MAISISKTLLTTIAAGLSQLYYNVGSTSIGQAVMQREIENDVRMTMAVSTRASEPPLEPEIWEAWQDDIANELGLILERLEALDLSGPALHIESAIEALRNAKP